ncbi:MAG: hypothetical protein FWG67_00795 [Defluviitaleaceae bacterium]|nr:hypothetical protein [Defluviitaleaceae bacterium]
MTHIFNGRIKRLMKEELIRFGKHLLGFLGTMMLIAIIMNLLHDTDTIHRWINNYLINSEAVVDFRFFNFGFFIFFIFVSGIVTGYELPDYVRKGISRSDYFVAETLSAFIVSLLIAPIMLTLNVISHLIFPSDSLFYHAFQMGNGDPLILILQFLVYMALFFLGYLITTFWNRVGWVITIATAIGIFILLSFVSLNFMAISHRGRFNFSLNLGLKQFDVTFRSLAISLLVLIPTLGTITYFLVKSIPVKAT